MRIVHRFLKGLAALFRRRGQEQELDRDLEEFWLNAVENNVARGMSRADAERAARVMMGSRESVKDAVRDTGWEFVLETFGRDLRFGMRLLRRSPGFTAVAVAALALGIGANTAIFSVVNAVILAPPPFKDPDRLVMVWEKSPRTGLANVVNPLNFLEWKARSRSFSNMAAWVSGSSGLTGTGEPEQVETLYVSEGFFSILEVQPMLGRLFTPEDHRRGLDNVVVIAESLWRRRYAADPGLVGRTIKVDNQAMTVVGIMPFTFSFPFTKSALWQPLVLERSTAGERGRYLSTVARLRSGATVETAQAEMHVISAQLRAERPVFNGKWDSVVVGFREQVIGDVRTPLLVLLGAVLLVLFIACANVANLILMRATDRRHELAVRSALGASGLRLTRQFLTESALLASLGGVLGLLLGMWGVRFLTALLPDSIAYASLRTIHVDATVLGFTGAISALTVMFCGLVPAVRAGRTDIREGLTNGTRTVAGSRSPARSALVLAEVGLATILAVGAGLLIRSFARLSQVNPGFEPSQVLSAQVNVSGYIDTRNPSYLEFVSSLLERVRALPGVEAAGTSNFLPLGRIIPATGFWRADRAKPAPGDQPVTEVLIVMPGYFASMSIPLDRGRVFDSRDHGKAPLRVVVNKTLARSLYTGEDPVGKPLRIEWGPGDPSYEIIGVVADVHQRALSEPPKPAVFLCNLQVPVSPLYLTVRVHGDPHGLARSLEAEVHSLNHELPVSDIRTMDELVSDNIASPRFQTVLLAAFTGLALALAAIGIFGVIAYSVAQRTRELGIRRALGATAKAVAMEVLSQGLMLSTLGVIAGAVASLALTRLMRQLLYGVGPGDPVSLGVAVVTMEIIAVAASLLPALRAARVDAASALRME